MAINIQIDSKHLEQLAYIEQQTHRDPNTLISQAIEQQYQQLQTQNAKNGVEGLFWNQDAYSYIVKQSDIFDAMLPQLVEQYAGMYVLFEDANVIDADLDEDVLLDRVWETDFVRDRIAKYHGIFCHLVPIEDKINA
jgi:alpha-glucosidase (family GH31 glycosyl hydrolase)